MNQFNPTGIFSDPRLKNRSQEYSAYTDEDFQVWKLLFERQMEYLPDSASIGFLNGLETIGFTPEKIPLIEDADNCLAKTTGWNIQIVPGMIEDDLFFSILHHKRFPTSIWLRKMEELDYLQEPDMFHDAFAHLPMLTNPLYGDFLGKLAGIALKHLENPLAIELISRVYWFTIEFGLIREREGIKIYGSGILSSVGETKFCLSKEPKHLEFDVRRIMDTPYWKNKFQDRYFIIESYQQLYESIPEIEKTLEEVLKKPTK